MVRTVIDFETRSRIDLKKSGATKYAQDTSTDILCVAWKVNGVTSVWYPINEKVPGYFKQLFFDPNVTFVAHNASFEQSITEWVLFPKYFDSFDYNKFLSPERWICTAAKAAAHSLPRSLEEACIALDLPVKKDMEGRKLILKYCKPRRASKKNKAEWWEDPADIKRLGEYCRTDVEAEYLLDQRLPDLNPTERRVWCLDQKINKRGITVDLESVKTALEMVDREAARNIKRVQELTSGAIQNTTQREVVLNYINERGAGLPNLKADTVRVALKDYELDDECREILEIRQATSKTSTAKFKAFVDRTCKDGRLRDNLIYHGANTGRWSGSGVQLQNLAKAKIKDVDRAIEILKTGDNDLMRFEFGDVSTALSACIRGMITASPGKKLYCADYASIEARVLPWLAGDEKTLEVFRKNGDLYVEMAAEIFKKDPIEVTKEERQLGKIAILGLGYGMGKKKFFETCAAWGSPVSEELAARAVNAYREKFHLVVAMWRNIEHAAILAIKKNKVIKINRVTWFMRNGFLHCKLPSGRLLSYYKPRVVMKSNQWGGESLEIRYWAMNGLTRQWEETGVYGALLVENIDQAISRDLMAEAMLRIDDAGYDILVSVHDELIAEHDRGSVEEFCKLMATLPSWGAGIPLACEGWSGERYRK